MVKFISALIISVFLGIIVLSIALTAEGNTITVDENGNGDYISFQPAVENSSSGDIIRLWDGNYSSGQISINKDIDIMGNGTSETKIVFFDDKGLFVQAEMMNMSNFSITGGYISIHGNNISVSDLALENVYFTISGFGISKKNNNLSNISLKITDFNSLSGFSMSEGINVDNLRLDNKKLYYIQDVHSSELDPFIVENDAAAVLIYNSSNIIVRNNILSNINSIICYESNNITIQNNTILRGNIGISLINANNNTIIQNNISNVGWGISVSGSENQIINNTIMDTPTGIYLDEFNGERNLILSNNLLNSSLDVYLPKNIVKNNVIDDRITYSLINEHGTENDPILIQGKISNIYLENCSYVLVENATIDFGNIGIHMVDSHNIIVINSTIRNITGTWEQFSGSGIFLDSCSEVWITNNIISKCENHGLHILGGNGHKITENIFSGNEKLGIKLSADLSSGNVIENNIIKSSNGTLFVSANSGSLIRNNNITGNSIKIMKGNIVEKNSYNDGTLYYFEDIDGGKDNDSLIEFDASAVILYNCSGFQIQNNTIGNTLNGIIVENCRNIRIFNNTIYGSLLEGINVIKSENVQIENNQIRNNSRNGIYLSYCERIQIRNNEISYNLNGIFFDFHIKKSKADTYEYKIIGNSIYRNVETGIHFGQMTDGNKVTKNMIYENNIGIYLNSVKMYGKIVRNEIKYNQVYNNSESALNYSGAEKYNDFDYNWWGDSSGPFHSKDNPGGKGDTITGNIGFKPWLSSPDEHICEDSESIWELISKILAIATILGILITFTIWLLYPFFVEQDG